MISVAAAERVRIRDVHYSLQLAAVPALSAIALAVLASTLDETLWTTWVLLSMLLAVVPVAIRRLAVQLDDDRLQWLGYVALLRSALVLAVLYAGWVPQLGQTHEPLAYDPQRYYFEAAELARNNFDPSDMGISLNYTGILFYYGLLFKAAGHDPVLPAVLNMTVTLAATLLVIRIGYQVCPQRRPWDWTLGLLLLIPEVVWFDALASRETAAMSLLVFSTLSLGALFTLPSGDSIRRFRRNWLLGGAVSLVALGLIRTTMLIPAFTALVILYVVGPGDLRRRVTGGAWIGLAAIVLLAGPAVAESIGGYEFGYIDWLRATRSPEYLEQVGAGWTERSVGQLLIPSNVFEEIAYAPIRGLAYLVAPLPRIPVTLVGLDAGSWSDWQSLATLLSALLYVVLFPALLVSAFAAISERRREWLLVHVPFWCAYAAIAGANVIIQERYRLMMVPLMWAAIWLGWRCDRRLLTRVYGCWLVLIAVGGILFAAYKVDF